jgi:hypothetical protein
MGEMIVAVVNEENPTGKVISETPLPVVDVKGKTLPELCHIIRKDWKNVYFGARPYVEALECLDNVNETYIMDSGKTLVLYFLANASTWRGPVAKAVKAELKALIK